MNSPELSEWAEAEASNRSLLVIGSHAWSSAEGGQ